MVNELNFSTLSHVLESWEQLKRIGNYQDKAGKIVFRHLFEKCPEAKVLFGFPLDINANSSELLDSKRFKIHAAYMIDMLDTSINMLGPDIELLTEIMVDLGTKHVRFGVKPKMFAVMGDALLLALEENLGEKFTEQTREAWISTYAELSKDMLVAQKVN